MKFRQRFATWCQSVFASDSVRSDRYFQRRFRALMTVTAGGVIMTAGGSRASEAATNSVPETADLSLEQLVNLKVTSVSKEETTLNESPAAITVITQDDIRNFGLMSIPDALRLVPGMDVAQINSSTWAISARGFDEIYSRSLLVMVDGRTVFQPFAGGVYWDLQQQMMEDLDRIEVITGPGGTLWGANAVNGVVNIVSKSARDTQGGLLEAGGGSTYETMDGFRYGGQIDDNTYYRVFGSYQKTASFDAPDGSSAGTGDQGGTAGFRLDHYGPQDASQGTLQSDVTYNDLLGGSTRDYDVNTLGRWTRTFSDTSSLEFQTYFDRTVNDSWGGVNLGQNTYDLEAQHDLSLGQYNDVVWGLGYRFWDVSIGSFTDSSMVLESVPRMTEQRADIFAQDTFKIVPDKFTVTAGAKVEYNTITSVEFEPSVRVMFKPAENQTLWGAVSRSVLVPTMKAGIDGYVQASGNPYTAGGQTLYPGFVSNSDLKSAPVWTYELGYRLQPAKRVSFDISTYYSRYSDLQNQVDTGNTMPFQSPHDGLIEVQQWQNAFDAETYGGEASVTVQPWDPLRLTGFYSLMKIREWGAVLDPDVLGGSPEQQVGLRASYDFTKRASVDGQLRYVGQVAGAPAYVTGDLRLSYRPTDHLELSVVGQNLFQPGQVELGAGQFTEDPRGVYGKITWKF
ncbi:MAG: TonB-dependent receptor [Verrucomicrobiota bacterium]